MAPAPGTMCSGSRTGRAWSPVMRSASRSMSIAIDAAARRVVLDGSIVLDDTPGPERIWAVISDRPITVAELSARLAVIQVGGAAAIRLGAELVIPGAR